MNSTTGTVFVDANVLVYARDGSHPEKQRRASVWLAYLWESRRGRLSVQVLNEFYVTVTQKLRPGLARDAARSEVRDLLAWEPVLLGRPVLDRAWLLQDRYGLSFWDATIVSAAHLAACRYVLTEDLQSGQDLDGVTVVSPFEAEPESLA